MSIQYDRGVKRPKRKTGAQPADAKNRRPVRLPDGRTARLVYVNPYTDIAKVQLPGGGYLTTSVEQLTVLDEPDRQHDRPL